MIFKHLYKNLSSVEKEWIFIVYEETLETLPRASNILSSVEITKFLLINFLDFSFKLKNIPLPCCKVKNNLCCLYEEFEVLFESFLQGNKESGNIPVIITKFLKNQLHHHL